MKKTAQKHSHVTEILDPRLKKTEKWTIHLVSPKHIMRINKEKRASWGCCALGGEPKSIYINNTLSARDTRITAIHETLHAMLGYFPKDDAIIDGMALSICNVLEVLRFEGKL